MHPSRASCHAVAGMWTWPYIASTSSMLNQQASAASLPLGFGCILLYIESMTSCREGPAWVYYRFTCMRDFSVLRCQRTAILFGQHAKVYTVSIYYSAER